MADRINAIQTRYKGCHFRSRLEARWAVFFDSLGIEWAYEEEGFEKISHEGFFNESTKEWETVAVDVERYLPDFRIGKPGSNLYAEVKGDKAELIRKKDELNELHDFEGILPNFSDSLYSHDRGLLLLGEIPFPNKNTIAHPIIQHRKGVWKSYAIFRPNNAFRSPIEVVQDSVISTLLGCDPSHESDWDNTPKSLNLGCFYPIIEKAYTAARSARFEHGESGAT